jgi:YVTN family beta-propeller protein
MTSGADEPTGAATPKVFICYRREDTAAHAGRLYDAMVGRFGEQNVFMDLDLAPGVDFVERIPDVVAACHVLIVVMGPRWATVEDDEGHVRIADPEDFVRIEVETALHNPDVTPIPVLVSGAKMPKRDNLPPEVRAITRRNALELSEARWRYDVDRLNDTLDQLLADRPVAPLPPSPERAAVIGEAAKVTVEAHRPTAPAADAAVETGPSAPATRQPSRTRLRRRWALVGLAGLAVIGILVALLAGGGGGGGVTVGPAIPVGTKPVGIAVGKAAIWVSNRDAATVTHLRADGTLAHPAIPVAEKPSGLVVNYGKVWVTNAGKDSVTPIDPSRNIADDAITVGDDPRAIGAGYKTVWVADTGSDSIFQLDRDGNTVGEPIPVGDGPRGITVGRGGVWVSNGAGDSVSVIDPHTRDVTRIGLAHDADPKGSAIAHNKLWVADEGVDAVTPIDVKKATAEDPIPVGHEPRDVVFSKTTNDLYVTNGGDDSVTVIDPVSGQVSGSRIDLPSGSAPENVSAGFGKIWVAAGGTNRVIQITP